MGDWKVWSLHAWNERLLAHFFERRENEQNPVVTLLLTSEVLARITGDSQADPESARDAFVEAVRAGIRRSGSLLESATDYQGWPDPPPRGSTPRFVAHLLFTCVAASESSEDLGNEESFIARLRELTGNQLPGSSLVNLPRLWQHLAKWLESNGERYRRLQLPDPGGLTRIGYTVRLSFPDRRDQKLLSDILDRAGLSGIEPPVGRVLSVVASDRARFRPSFVKAFDEFRELYQGNGDRSQALLDHRFWAAVREAALRGRGYEEERSLVRISLLAEEQDETLVLFVVSDGEFSINSAKAAELPFAYGPWAFGLIAPESDGINAAGLNSVVAEALDRRIYLPRVSNQVAQGLLPFVDGAHGLLELATRDQLSDVSIVLLREELLSDFSRFVCPTSRSRPSIYSGWVQINKPSLRTFSCNELNGTALERTWILQDTLTPTAIRLDGGVRADDGWIGATEVLPTVVAQGASEVILEGAGLRENLQQVDGTWKLPHRDFTGEFTLLAISDGRADSRRLINFVAAPSSENFKRPSEPGAWVAEGMCAAYRSLGNTEPFSANACATDRESLCERVAYLGMNVGEFCVDPQEAAWRVVNFGGKLIGARGLSFARGYRPTSQSEDANSRSRWRKMLLNSSASRLDSEFEAARRSVKGAVCRHDLPKIELHQAVPHINPIPLIKPSALADRFLRILASRASSRSGIPWREWSELAMRVLRIDHSKLEMVTRAWSEAGLIDVVASARWRHNAIFARHPLLVAYTVGDLIAANVTGLILPASLEQIRKTALRHELLVEERHSVSELVPGTIALRAFGRSQLEALATSAGIDVVWLDLERLDPIGAISAASDAPEHYESSTRWQRWSLDGVQQDQLDFRHWVRKDRPDFWSVTSDAGNAWSYSLNTARLWASSFAGLVPVKETNAGMLEACHAFMPLPLARAVSVMGAGLAGPSTDGRYRYPISSPALREFAVRAMSTTFNISSPDDRARQATEVSHV